MRKLFGLERNVFFLGLVSLFNDFSAEMVQSVMPVFLTTVLGAPVIFVGLIEGVADALASFLKIFSGWFSDKIHKRKLPSVLGYTLSVGIRPLLAAVTNFWQVFGLRVVDRIGKGFRDAPRDALLSESSSREEFGKSFGYNRMMDRIGATVGPLVAFFLLPALGNNFRGLFLIAFVVGIFSIFSFVFVHEKKNIDGMQPHRISFKAIRANQKFYLLLRAMFVFGLGTLPVPLLLLRAPEVGTSVAGVPLFYFLYSLSFVIASLPLGKWSDRVGQERVIIFGFVVALFAYIGLGVTKDFVSLACMFVLLGVYGSATDGIGRALAAKLVPHEALATGQGLLNAAIGISALLAGVIGGALWTYIGSYAAFLYAAGMSMIGLVMFILLTRSTAYNGYNQAH